MYTQCPHCQTIFGVSETHLSAAFGRVRCGHCRGQFNAKLHLLNKLPEPPPPEPTTPPAEPIAQTEPTEPVFPESPLNNEIESDEATDLEPTPPPVQAEDNLPVEQEPLAETVEPEPVEQSDAAHEPPPTIEEETPPLEFELELKDDEQNDAPSPSSAMAVTDNAELDAIFAELDNRLEKLTEDSEEPLIPPLEPFDSRPAEGQEYNDAFGEPDDQSEEEIRASIETIFAAAEEELQAGGETAEDSQDLASADSELQLEPMEETPPPSDTDEVEAPPEVDSTQVEDSFSMAHDKADSDATEMETEELPEADSTQVEDNVSVAHNEAESGAAPVETEGQEGEDGQPSPDFTQEEFLFDLHAEDKPTTPAPHRIIKTLALGVLALLLVLGIGFQLALFRNVELANKLPILRPYLVLFCQHLPCRFMGQRDVKQIHLTSRDVRTHPQNSNTILINAIFVNNAEFEQPYPDILITLSDVTTTVMAQRRFTPQDYLSKTGAFMLMKPGKPVHITLEVLDPGNDAINFEFEFL